MSVIKILIKIDMHYSCHSTDTNINISTDIEILDFHMSYIFNLQSVCKQKLLLHHLYAFIGCKVLHFQVMKSIKLIKSYVRESL